MSNLKSDSIKFKLKFISNKKQKKNKIYSNLFQMKIKWYLKISNKTWNFNQKTRKKKDSLSFIYVF